jgi:Protein of unknown function (DUF3298)
MLKIIMFKLKTDSMTKISIFSFFILISSLSACKNESKKIETNTVSNMTTTPVTTVADIEHKEISRRQVDALGNGKGTVAAGYIITYPSVKKGSVALTESVKKWAHTFISEQIGFQSVIEPELGYQTYVAMFRQVVENNTNIKSWEVNIEDNIIYNTLKFSSLRIDAKTNFGSVNDKKIAAINSFDTQTGEILSCEKLVVDQAAMLALCEKNLRLAQADIFKEGFKFTQNSPFKLPKNFAITPQGLLLHYNPNEIAPNISSSAEFIIPFEQLEKIMDLKKYI